MSRDDNDRRISAYYARSAPYRAADPLGFRCRFIRGLAIQRDLFEIQDQPTGVISLRRKREVMK